MAAENVNKCPACGTLRPAMATECPACGYVFTDSGAKVVVELSDKLNSVRGLGDKAVIDVIKSFHIPHIKEELLDVMFFIQPKALEKTSSVSLAWRDRQREVFERAKVACAHDRSNLEKVLSYEAQIEKITKQRVRNTWIMLPTWAKVAIPVGVLFLILLMLPARDISPEAYQRRFVEAVQQSNWDMAIKHIASCPTMGVAISSQYLDLVEGLMTEGRLFEAEQLFDARMPFVEMGSVRAEGVAAKFIDTYLASNQLDKAIKYATSLGGLERIMRYYIEQGCTNEALALYRRNSSKFSKYDYQLHRKVSLCKDEVVNNFLAEQGIKIE